MASGGKYPFPRNSRILHSADFRRLKIAGERIASGCILVNWMDAADAANHRVGIITTKRLGNAVTRNRARRLIREAFRHIQGEFVRTVELVIVARPSIVRMQAGQVAHDLRRFAERIDLIPKKPRSAQ